MMVKDDAVNELLAAEQRRSDALTGQYFARLGSMLSHDLVHVHARGNQDTRDTYLHFVSQVIEVLEVQRQRLEVHLHGEFAVMTGRQIQTSRTRDREDRVTIKSQVMQVWQLTFGGWQLVAFQATPLGPLPPVPETPRAL